MTRAERRLWSALRRGAFGVKFRRQAPIGPFIVDFVALSQRLVIEVDGGQHAENARDEERDRFLQGEGFTVLRFWNNEVLGNIEGVLAAIGEALVRPSP